MTNERAPASWWRRRTGGLGSGYWRLLAAVASSNLGDGFAWLAFPWLASLLTRDPLAVSGVALATRLPWLLFSLHAGVLTDVLDRRRLMVTANTARALVAAATTAAVALDVMTLPLLYAAAFLLGMCEVVFDNTSQALLPALVPREHLERANGNIIGAQMVIADFASRPLAGAAVGVALSLPFAIDAATAALSAALIAAIPGRFTTTAAIGKPSDTARRPMRAQIAEGVRWLWHHHLLRRLALALAAMNGTNALVIATFVLFVQEILGLGGLGFGLVMTAGGVGGVAGSALAPGVVTRLGPGPSLLLTITVPIAGFTTMAVSSQPVVIGACFAATAFTAVVWNVVTVSLRQTIIPDELLGRVNSVYRFLGWGAMPLGTALGGALVSATQTIMARELALRSPFAFAVGVHLLLLVLVAPRLRTHLIEQAKTRHP